jgi:hypothetical protein
VRPLPLGRRVDVADDGLPSLGDVDVLDGHFLLALRPPASQNPSFLIDSAPERMDRRTIFLPNDRSSVRSCTN